MAQKGNYIIKSENKVDIFYTHWRANLITNDLLLGTRKFIEFIKQFDKQERLINEPWLEGCVLVDLDTKKLIFWEIEQLFEYSVKQEYIRNLKKKWPGWQVTFAEKEMYDIENELEIDYTKNQDKDLGRMQIEGLINDTIDEYISCLIIIKKENNFKLKKLYTGSDEQIALLGEQIINILEDKPSYPLIKETEIDIWNIILINIDNKSLYINQSITGLKEELVDLWAGWEIEVGNFGYINLLEKAGYETNELRMKKSEIDERMKEILNYKDDFNPLKTFERILESGKDVKFHPNFFENIKPKKTFFEKIKSIFSKN